MSGHLFIINGDLNKIACDALLIPTDSGFNVEAKWDTVPEHLVEDQRRRGWNGRQVLRLFTDAAGRQIWLGNVGVYGRDRTFEVFAPKVRAFIAEASSDLASLSPEDRRWLKPRLAMNVVGSGDGGGSDVKGNLLKGLVELLESLAMAHEVDLILVTFGEKPYAAAQRVRKQLHGSRVQHAWEFDKGANPRLTDEAAELANQAIASQLVLFIGAGVSAGAGLPTWEELITSFARDALIEDEQLVARLLKKDLRDAATILERLLDPWHPECAGAGGYLRSTAATKLGAAKVYALAHGLLASLPSEEAVTTNFDTLFESSVRVAQRDIAVLPNDPRSTGGRWLLKLHGTLNDPRTLILTRSDYLNMPRQYGALMGLVQGLLMMRHLMFVGYSLRDEDFHELVHEVREARGDSAVGVGGGTVLTLFDDDLDRQLWINDLRMVPMMSCAPPDDVAAADKAWLLKQASRELEVFLDLVGYLSTTSAAFFLDDDYLHLMSDPEAELRDLLLDVYEMSGDVAAGPVAEKVRQFLVGELGAGDDT